MTKSQWVGFLQASAANVWLGYVFFSESKRYSLLVKKFFYKA
jgi:hypothetical protein